ncbi:zinc finger protein 804B isoform X2 [Hemicordylus capensis]|uniref:zinc finger protein 804B isoform X2 n=1 Tax=Hemicordylus capensis TaxID=884348 RepID=UPI002304692A|nr:zinc finger protein 804B isoform X2 [Hemicordylus capensis]
MASTRDFAEKEKAAARALEDVKANFYCELCDKQYHKHHEFDNHINSYDHAHKQRLKELKQREFARNVASKSWKDEKKQEKALKRLHQLAELRKQSECVAGCRPVLKMPQVVVEKQQRSQEKLIFAQKGKKKSTAEGHILTSSTSEKQQELLLSKNQSCIEKCRLLRNRVSCSTDACNRTGVSFSFSRKVHLKLESSASVFSENMEEAFDCNGSPRHTVKQTSKECNACLHMSDERKASLQKRLNTLQGHPDSTASCNQAAKNKTLKGNDQNAYREQVETHLSFCRDKIQSPECASAPGGKEQGREPRESKRFSETIVPSQYQMSNVSMQQNTYKHSDVLLAERIFELSAQQSPEQGHLCEVNYSPCIFKANGSSESSKAANANTETPRGDALVHEIKPKALPFLHVLSKDGSTALRWPTELLLFTKTEPSISYGCNPLYFDFKLSLSHRDNEHHEANTGSCKEHSKTMDIDGNEASGLPENKQLSNEQDNQSLKPKKKKRALSLKRSQPNLDSDPENETNQSAPKYISEELNENLPQVPAQLDCSQRHRTRATSPHRNIPVRSLAQHLQSCEKTLRDEVTENICIYPLVSRTKMQKCVQCEFMYSQRKNNPDLVTTCSSDISDSGKDSILGYPFGSPEKCVENEGKPSFAGCWKFSSLQKSSTDRQSNYSDTSVSSATSYISCYSSHRSSDHSRSHLAFCCKRKQKPVERQKCKHKKHNCISSSDDADEDCLFDNKSQRSRNCTQRQTVKYQRHSRYRHLLQRDISKPSRNRHPLCKHSRSRSYSSSKGSSIRDSGSSERSLSCTRSRGSRSGSLAKESMYSWNQRKEEMKSNYEAESGKSDAARSDCQDGSCLSKHAGTCSINHLGRESVGQEKSLTAKLLLEKVKSKKNQEQLQNMGGFSSACRIDLPYSPLGIKCGSPLESEAAFLLPEKALNINTNSVWNNETSPVESSADKAKAVATVIKNGTLTASTNYSNCLLQDLIQRGTGYQAPSVEVDAAIKEHSSILTDEKQCFLPSGDPVPNGFPGAFPLNSYPLVPNAMETKEEHSASANWNQVEGNLSSYSDSPMHKHNDTESKTELYSKCISSPLTQQPITFSPDEIDKYRFLQLQAQQHMQKQLVAKHFKVLPATGPAAFSASPAVHPLPVQQHASVATLHQTLLQSFALSAAVHPHSSHLSVTHIHPFPQSHFAPISLSPFTPAFMPMHAALLSGHPFHLVSASPIHSSHLTIPPLPHAAFLPTLFAPQLNAAASSAIHLNPLIHPFFQGQELQHHS